MCGQATSLKSHVLALFIAFIAIALDRWSYEPPAPPPPYPASESTPAIEYETLWQKQNRVPKLYSLH
jgi:hypothetical protein